MDSSTLIKILDQSKRGQALSERLRKLDDKYQSQLGPLQLKLEKVHGSLKDEKVQKTPETLFKLRRDQRLLEMELQSFRERAQFEIESARNHFRELLLAELQPMMKDLATSEALDAILTLPNPGIPYFNNKHDLTEGLLKRYDNYSK